MFDPAATYRLQLHKDFTFAHLEEILPYLEQLGMSTIYASPIFTAVPGSTHGYDGLDPQTVNPEIGTMDQLLNLSKTLKQHGMHWLQDIVPNHLAFHPGNAWLMDVLEKGDRSEYASYFDICHAAKDGDNRLMVPFLGASLDDAIASFEVQVTLQDNRLYLSYYDNAYPLNISGYFGVLLDTPAAWHDLVNTLVTIDGIDDKQYHATAWSNWLERFAGLLREEENASWLQDRLLQLNVDPATLQRISALQYYRLCHWQETDQRINYRRFFTVNGLICLNEQEAAVFDAYHSQIRQLLQQGIFQGVRVDHIDGLYNPNEYLQQLRLVCGDDRYIVVEKILAADEDLPQDWPIQGATGYEFLATVSNLLTRKESESAFTAFYESFIHEDKRVAEQVPEKKKYILTEHMAGEWQNLYELFLELGLADIEMLDSLAPGALKNAIADLLVNCPVYRFYGGSMPLDADEGNRLRSLFDVCRRANPDLGPAFGLLETALLGTPAYHDDNYLRHAVHFYKRCMQFTGPLMAKGVEDTLMYTYNRFIAHNEVGDAPGMFGITAESFHSKMIERQRRWPLALNATSSHDTKRGEDARARLNALGDVPDDWFRHVAEWQQLNAPIKQHDAPDANDEYFIYQTLIGTYPMPGANEENYADRLDEYLQKMLREAKRHSGWTTPDEAYENACKHFARALLNKRKPFWKSFRKLHASVADLGIINSLTQLVLKCTAPGVPDFYQGCEWWDLSFVDPDNRRPVAYGKHSQLLQSVSGKKGKGFIKNLWLNRYDGRIKIWLTQTLLRLRKERALVFSQGEYIPIGVEGAYRDHVLAFARKHNESWIITVLPLHIAVMCREQDRPLHRLHWKDTRIILPIETRGSWKNEFFENKGSISKELLVSNLFQPLPFAVLFLEDRGNDRGAGVLLHITSLPAPFGIGDLGPESYAFVDFLFRSGQKYWQLLPVNPVEAGQGYSPYSATSSRAGNPWLISPELLAKEGLLPGIDLANYYLSQTHFTDYPAAEKIKRELFARAWNTFRQNSEHPWLKPFQHYCEQEDNWLSDFALYTILKETQQGKPWYEWAPAYRQRQPEAMLDFARQHEPDILATKWLQFIFDRQWVALKTCCQERQISLIGDLPFYVSYDSADVWSHQELFAVNDAGERKGIAGVPPDAFSEDGQLWGMPVFNWPVLKAQGYRWWIDRLKKNMELFDLIRLDHFRAFSAYWEVAAGASTARFGSWKTGPGADFFEAAKDALGNLPFLAEDLGDIDQPVIDLREQYSLPGMKILQFAFGDDFPTSPYLPHNHTGDFFAYTGTHDNNTTRGWYRKEAGKLIRERLTAYTGKTVNEKNVHLELARMAYASVARTVILPLQDILGLDENARMNIPSTTTGNWSWRIDAKSLAPSVAARLLHLAQLYQRL